MVASSLIQCHPFEVWRSVHERLLFESWNANPQTHGDEGIDVSRVAVYAIGGNALSSPHGQDDESTELVLAQVMSDVVDLLEAGWGVVLTHGNGPQVGHLMELDRRGSHEMDAWVSATQGMIGHSLSLNLDSILNRRRRPERTACIITRVLVDGGDSGFSFPTKPVGPVLTPDVVMSADWDIAETVSGPRRVVASPLPMKVLDLEVIQALIKLHAVVICGGGGGIPVVARGQHFVGVPAVIDKDRLSSLLAIKLKADALIISTAVDAVRTNFGQSDEQIHRRLSIEDCERFMEEGHFPKGSMEPKIGSLMEAALHCPGLQAILCQPGDALESLRGDAGTTVFVA